MHALRGASWDIPNTDSEPGKARWFVKGNPEGMPHKSNLNHHEGSTLSEPACVSSTCTLFPLNKYFTCFTIFCLCGNSFLQSWRARALSLASHLRVRIPHSLLQPKLNLWWGTETLLQAVTAEATQDHTVLCFVGQMCPTLCDSMHCSPPGSSVHGDSPGKNTGVGCHALLQGIFPTQGSNSGLPPCKWILYCLSYQGNPKIILGAKT